LKTLAITFVCLSVCITPVFAADWLPLPQSLKDLRPVMRQDALPLAPNVKVAIPPERIAPAPAKAADVLRLAPGKSQTVALSRDAASVIVASPTHASVFLDNSRLLVVVPRAPGATTFTVLDKEGQTILSQPIIVTEKDDPAYVRVTRICGAAGTGATCMPISTYYCPDNCVPVAVPNADIDAAMTPAMPSVASAASGAAN
jgi:hypothetical protein